MSKVTAFTFGVSNLYVVEDKGTIIVDTGCDASREEYLRVFSQSGIDPKAANLIVITHGHSDHFARVSELKELTGAPVVCHKNAVHALQTGTNPKFIPRGEEGKEFLKLIQPVPEVSKPLNPDLTFDTVFDLNPYGVSGKIIHTPGHSDCSSSVILDTGEAFIGDMVIVSPFTGKLSLALLATDEEMLRVSLRMVVNSACTFYGGHGGPYSREEVLKLL